MRRGGRGIVGVVESFRERGGGNDGDERRVSRESGVVDAKEQLRWCRPQNGSLKRASHVTIDQGSPTQITLFHRLVGIMVKGAQ